MPMQSRHFNLAAGLTTSKGNSELGKGKSSLGRSPSTQRKEVFFRSGKGQGLYKMTLNDTFESEKTNLNETNQ